MLPALPRPTSRFGDPAVEYYLSGPWLREVTSQPNSVPEREGGIDDLVVEGPFSGVPSQVYNMDEWPEQVHFRVTYIPRKTDSIGQPPGKRLWFVTVGRQAAESPWKKSWRWAPGRRPSAAEPPHGAGVGLGRLDLTVLGSGCGHERIEQRGRRPRYLVDRPSERLFVRGRRRGGPLIFRTNCRAAARISSSVAGGSKL